MKRLTMERTEVKFMRRALFLAEYHGKIVSPNPKVGAVLVKDGRVVGEGAHSRFGGPHAEIVALRRAGTQAQGATLYVTLEPCSHHGKTPPCAHAVIGAGVKKVVAAMEDPYPLVRGRGFGLLRRAGIKVKVGLLEKEARFLNESFIRGVSRNRPWVILKAAVSSDGKIAPPDGLPRWITGKKARLKAHEIRSRVDAILVGRKTVRKDNPSLTVRLPGYRRQDGWPLRVVLDSGLGTSPQSKIFQGKARTVLFTSPAASRTREKALERKGIFVFRVPLLKKMLSLRAILKKLYSFQVRTLLVEGGSEVHRSFIEGKFVDELALFLSPKALGAGAVDWMGPKGLETVLDSRHLKDSKLDQWGPDFLLTGRWKG